MAFSVANFGEMVYKWNTVYILEFRPANLAANVLLACQRKASSLNDFDCKDVASDLCGASNRYNPPFS